MKKLIITCVLGYSATTFAQIGIGIANPKPSSALEISSTDKGLLIPRMTSVQRKQISKPADGLMVFQVDSARGLYFYDSLINTWCKNAVSVIDTNSAQNNNNSTLKYLTDTFFNLNKTAQISGGSWPNNGGVWSNTFILDSFDLKKGVSFGLGITSSFMSFSNHQTTEMVFYICDKNDKKVQLRLNNQSISATLSNGYTLINSNTFTKNYVDNLMCFIPKDGRYYLKAELKVSQPVIANAGRASITLNSCIIDE